MTRKTVTMILLLSISSAAHAQSDGPVIKKYQLWYDGNYNEATTGALSGRETETLELELDVSEQIEGMHMLSYRFADDRGRWSPVSSWVYMVNNAPVTKTVTHAEYWIDQRYDKVTTLPMTGTALSFVIDASALSEGMHSVSYRVKDDKGGYSATSQWSFYKTTVAETEEISAIEYWIDTGYDDRQTVPATAGENVFEVDASRLVTGMHMLCYRVKTAQGSYSSAGTWMFYKQGDERTATAITWYQYWWNDNIDQAVRREVESADGVYEFNQQLTIPRYARTGYNGQPLMARLNVVFGDDNGNVSPLTYVDVTFPDVDPPVTEISADKKAAYTSVNISWSGTDEELKDYNVYVSENGLPYLLWLPNTTATTAEFKGEAGKTYRFTVTGRDKTGNIERFDADKCATVKFNK